MTKIFDLEQVENSDVTTAPLYEVYLTDGEVSEGDNGLIWKDVLVEGEWAYRPGPGQKPVPVPLKIVPGNASDPKEIGMADIIESFEDGAIDHVTVPTSHDDKPHENTGYVRELRKIDRDGKAVLQTGIEFTEPDIKSKALRGTIAGTSAGIIFDYIKKSSGKIYKQALGHVALTNKPWVNGMKPFGVAASENFSGDDITSLMLENVVWDSNKSLNWLRDKVSTHINASGADAQFFVADIAPSRALIAKFSNNGSDSEHFVVPFVVGEDSIEISGEEDWIKASQEWVETSMSEENDVRTILKDFDGEPSGDLSEESADSGVSENEAHNGGKNMASETQEGSPDTGANNDPAQDQGHFSEEQARTLLDEQRSEFETKLSEQDAENKSLRAKVHAMEVEKRVGELKEIGFSDFPGLLSEIRNIMLADDGKPALILSEESENGETSEVTLNASEIVERIVDALPKEGDRLAFAEQAIVTEDHSRPSSNVDESDVEDRAREIAKSLGRDYPKDGDE